MGSKARTLIARPASSRNSVCAAAWTARLSGRHTYIHWAACSTWTGASNPYRNNNKFVSTFVVYVCVCIYVCMYTWMGENPLGYVYMYVCVHVCILEWLMYVCMYVCVHVCILELLMYVCMYVYVCLCMHVRTNLWLIYFYLCMCMYVCMYEAQSMKNENISIIYMTESFSDGRIRKETR